MHSITQAEIARKVGVSQPAVSAILGNSPNASVSVSDETRTKILSVAGKLGYRVRKKRTLQHKGELRNVLLVERKCLTHKTDEGWMAEANAALQAKLSRTCAECLAEADIKLTLLNEDDNRVVRWLKESDISGVLWHVPDVEPIPMQWVAAHYPTVLINGSWDGNANCDIVSLNQEKALSLAAEHLWSRGHRRIAMFGHWKGISFYRRRVAAYKNFVEQKELRDYVEFREISDDPKIAALSKVEAILKLWRDMGSEAPTALITPDVFALPLIQMAPRYGVQIPKDLSLAGMDNLLPCQVVNPALTAIDLPFEEMARAAVDLLIQRMNNPEKLSCSLQITPRLMVRNSVEDFGKDAPREHLSEAAIGLNPNKP